MCVQDPNWYKAKHVDGRIGLIPANYIQKRSEVRLNAMPWFHGKITREDAEALLQPREVSIARLAVCVSHVPRCVLHRIRDRTRTTAD